MDHREASELTAERYLLDDLTPAQREGYEAHFFACPICAQDLRVTAELLDLTRAELRGGNVRAAAPRPARPSWLAALLHPALVAPAFAVLLAVIAYQYEVVYPRLGTQLAQLRQPHVVSALSLIGANARDGSLVTASAATGEPLLLAVDIPAADRFSGYACVLVDGSGTAVWRVAVTPDQARDTVSIAVPAGTVQPGSYTLVVQGLPPGGATPGSPGAATELVRYRFALTATR